MANGLLIVAAFALYGAIVLADALVKRWRMYQVIGKPYKKARRK